MGKRSLPIPGLKDACLALQASSEPTSEGTEEEGQLERLCASFLFPALISRAWFPSMKPLLPTKIQVLIPRQLAGSHSSPGETEAQEVRRDPSSHIAESWQVLFLQNCSKFSIGLVDTSQQ